MSKLYILFEHAAGYALFKSSANEESDLNVHDIDEFRNFVTCSAFMPFKTGKDALENINSISEGILHPQLQEFLEGNIPKKKKHPVVLGVAESKLGTAIMEQLEINCKTSTLVAELTRGLRRHFHELVEGFKDLHAANQTQLGLGHHYSRARVKFNVNKIDNMIIQSISLIDQLDKDINTFTMRIREWYSHHFPELIKIVPENIYYVPCVKAIRNRKEMSEDIKDQLEEILKDPVKAQNVIDVAHTSMGMDITEIDLENVYEFSERVMSLTQRRKELMEYLRSKMHSVSPNLSILVGDIIAARLIAHAGSLTNLAKSPASTIQILGAEKALFRAIKTRGRTPKYGLIYNSKFIAKAAKGDKGRVARYLANKLSVCTRIDCFRDVPTEVFGEKLHRQVEDRLKFYASGELPAKNVDVMEEAMKEAAVAEVEIVKQMKKDEKKARKRKLNETLNDSNFYSSGPEYSFVSNNDSMAATEATEGEEGDGELKQKKKKKKKKKHQEEQDEEMQNGLSSETAIEPQELPDQMSPKKKKSLAGNDFNTSGEIQLENGLSSSGKKKKKKRKSKGIGENMSND